MKKRERLPGAPEGVDDGELMIRSMSERLLFVGVRFIEPVLYQAD
ncbi:MAG: hypothetical protein NTZ78_06950 [Candidatus Aureabacteria bacterium]|nr:hypothetical protein [Candidatus Auribacterota bacterium]